jgi:osmotically-inducible protein OsmY
LVLGTGDAPVSLGWRQEDGLSVERADRDGGNKAMTQLLTKTDAEIQQDVLRELKWDTRVNETQVGVEVSSGVVTLSGTVNSWAKRTAAQEAAHRVLGVLDVANDLQVRLTGTLGRTDTEIARSVRHSLEWDVFVPDTRIRSTVSEGQVTLEGEVDYWTQREDAGKAVRNLAGVRSVLNLISIKPPKVAAEAVHKAIEEALERRADREAQRIKVELHDGRVSIAGTVRSWGERMAAVEAARATAGVLVVDDRLRIDPWM